MIKTILILPAFIVTTQLNAQNLYPKKLSNCITSVSCLGCGDIKANVDKEKIEKLVELPQGCLFLVCNA